MQRVVRSMVQWGVLADSDTRGIYERSARITIVRPPVGKVLLEALLMQAEEKSLPVEQALRHPGLFPFEVELHAHGLRRSARFDVHRQGLDTDVVALRHLDSAVPTKSALASTTSRGEARVCARPLPHKT